MRVSEIADLLGTAAKPLYRRLARILARLQFVFRSHGIDAAVVAMGDSGMDVTYSRGAPTNGNIARRNAVLALDGLISTQDPGEVFGRR